MKNITLKYRRKNKDKEQSESDEAGNEDKDKGSVRQLQQPDDELANTKEDNDPENIELEVRGEDLTPRNLKQDQDAIDLDAIEFIDKIEQADQVQLDEIRPFLGSPIYRINNSINQLDKKITSI